MDVILERAIPPGPNAVEKEEIACPTKDVEAYPAVPKPATVEVRLGIVTCVAKAIPNAVEKDEKPPATVETRVAVDT